MSAHFLEQLRRRRSPPSPAWLISRMDSPHHCSPRREQSCVWSWDSADARPPPRRPLTSCRTGEKLLQLLWGSACCSQRQKHPEWEFLPANHMPSAASCQVHQTNHLARHLLASTCPVAKFPPCSQVLSLQPSSPSTFLISGPVSSASTAMGAGRIPACGHTSARRLAPGSARCQGPRLQRRQSKVAILFQGTAGKVWAQTNPALLCQEANQG